MDQPLARELTHHQYLRSRLEEAFPDADEETLVDTLEGLSNLPDMLAEVCRSMLDDQAMVSALRGRIGDMQERCGRIEARARKKRELVCSVMERADLKKVTEPDLTLSLRPARPPLAVVDEAAVPEAFWKPHRTPGEGAFEQAERQVCAHPSTLGPDPLLYRGLACHRRGQPDLRL